VARNPRTGVTLRDLQRGTTKTETIRNVNISWPREVTVVVSGASRMAVGVGGEEAVRRVGRCWGRGDRNSCVCNGRMSLLMVVRRVGIVVRNSVLMKGTAVSDEDDDDDDW